MTEDPTPSSEDHSGPGAGRPRRRWRRSDRARGLAPGQLDPRRGRARGGPAARRRPRGGAALPRVLAPARRRASSPSASDGSRSSATRSSAKAEAVVGRLDDAAPVRQGFENLVRALGDAAERLAREAERTRPEFEPPAFHEAQSEQQATAAEPEAPPPYYRPEPPGYQPQPPYAGSEPAARRRVRPLSSGQASPRWPSPAAMPASGSPTPSSRRRAPMNRSRTRRAPRPTTSSLRARCRPSRGSPLRFARRALTDGRGSTTRSSWRSRWPPRAGRGTRFATTSATRSASPIRSEILDEIFGAGTPEDARVPWTAFPR